MNTFDKPTIPRSYVLVTTYTTCTCCQHTAASSEFFALSFARSRNSLGEPVKHYEPIMRPQYRLPVTHTAARSTTPYCIRCPSIDLSHLPLPPSYAGLHDLPELVLKNARPATKGAAHAAPSHKPRIEDLA